MYVMAVGQYLLRENMVAEVVLAHSRLRLQPRSAQGGQKFMEGKRRQFAAESWCRRRFCLILKIPSGAPRSCGVEPRRQPDHQLPQAIFRIRPAVSGGGFGFDTVVAWGAGKRQLLRHLAAGVASPGRHAELQKYVDAFRRSMASFRTISPGAITTRSDRRAVDERDRRDPQSSRAPAQGRKVRHDEGA